MVAQKQFIGDFEPDVLTLSNFTFLVNLHMDFVAIRIHDFNYHPCFGALRVLMKLNMKLVFFRISFRKYNVAKNNLFRVLQNIFFHGNVGGDIGASEGS